MNNRVLISDAVHPCLVEGLSAKYHVTYQADIDQKGVEALLPELVGIVINSKTTLHARQISLMDNMKWIARLGSGMSIIDRQEAEGRNITVINTPSANANAVAEHALGMLLSALHKLHQADLSIRNGQWSREQHRGRELSGMTIGIIGVGNNGSRFAEKLSGMGVTTLLYDKYLPFVDVTNPNASSVSLTELQERSDVISFHVPLTDETTHYFDSSFLSACRPGVILINTSRGRVVDQDLLVDSLLDGSVSWACLDVFHDEGLEALESPSMRHLRESAKTILSPHVAGWTYESKELISRDILDQLRKSQLL